MVSPPLEKNNEDDGKTVSEEDTESVNFDFRPVAFYIPVNDQFDNGNKYKKKKRKKSKSKVRENSEKTRDEPTFKLNHDEKMLQADILHQDQLNEKGEMSRKHQEKYEKAKTKREMIIENLRKKTEDKIIRAEEKRKRRLAKQKEKLKAAEERLEKVRCRKETMDQNFREKTASKIVEDEERLQKMKQNDVPLRAIFRREEILRYRQKLYEDRQLSKERTDNKNE
ncbi:inner centromere protein B-like [Saccostrea echinata]|uniref:inner centromere protein B-like n=1 Tax=Saccostrea echinata TaxID=191078 RepID=UPI002A840EAB|nr:inner centromere protein B-like [Saccostrea echinata]